MESSAAENLLEPFQKASALIRANKEEIIRTWEERLQKGNNPAALRLSTPRLRDGLPSWLDRLAEALKKPNSEFKYDGVSATAKEHGRQRAELDFEWKAVLHEYVTLRRVLFEILERDHPLEPWQRDILLDAVSISISSAVAELMRLSWQQQRDILSKGSSSLIVKLIWTASIVGATTAMQWIFWPLLDPHSYMLFFPAVILAALYGNGPFAIMLSVLATEFFFTPPLFKLHAPAPDEWVTIMVFVGSAMLIFRVTNFLRSSRKMLEHNLEKQACARRDAERTLASLDSLLASAPIGMAFLDPQLNYVRVNEPLAGWTGISVEQHIGKSIYDVLGAEAKKAEPSLLKVLTTGESINNLEYEAAPKNDPARRHVFHSNFYPVRTAGGENIGVGALIADVTEQKMAETLREQFVSALSHDLRTPLTAARMSAQLAIRTAADPDRVLGNCVKVISGIDRADQMIRDLLDANQIRAGKPLPVELVPTELAALIRETTEELESIYGDRFDLDLAAPVEGEWDQKGLRRLIENLVNNAAKHGASLERIRIELVTDGENAEISVHNWGSPIPCEQHDKLFDYFHRGDCKKGAGWGIGLTLVKGVAEAHGGNVKVKSLSTEGTTFTVTLPLHALSQSLVS